MEYDGTSGVAHESLFLSVPAHHLQGNAYISLSIKGRLGVEEMVYSYGNVGVAFGGNACERESTQ